MIKKSEVDAALAAATRILAEESSFAWIKRTTLQVRAYFVGLYAGLSGIARQERCPPTSLIDVLQKTEDIFWAWDASSKSTWRGMLFDSLRQELLREEVGIVLPFWRRSKVLPTTLTRCMVNITRERSTREWRLVPPVLWNDARSERNKSTQTIAEQRDRQSDKNRRLAEELEHVVRHIALVDENWNNRDND